MKNILLIITLFLSLVGFTQSTSNFTNNNFIINGQIENATNCNYIIYDIDKNGLWRFLEKVSISSKFKITVKAYKSYFIIFKTKNKAKHLYLNLAGPSTENSIIDFKYDSHIVMYYDVKYSKYSFYLVDDNNSQILINKMYEQDNFYEK